MSPTLATFLFELVNFLLLAGLLGWLLFKPVRERIQTRQAAEKQRADELAARTAEADRLRNELQQRHDAFEHEMTELRTARLKGAEQEASTILARAREAAENERRHTASSLAQIERGQLEKLADAVAQVTGDAIARLLAAIDAPDLESGLVGTACRRLRELDAPSLGSVVIESARPLADQEQKALVEALGARAVSSTFRIVPALRAGVRVTTARGLIDASAAGIAAEAAQRLKVGLAAEQSQTRP